MLQRGRENSLRCLPFPAHCKSFPPELQVPEHPFPQIPAIEKVERSEDTKWQKKRNGQDEHPDNPVELMKSLVGQKKAVKKIKKTETTGPFSTDR
jgi:hypothetical protein